MSLSGLLFDAAVPDDQVQVYFDDVEITHGELVASATALRDQLRDAGLAPREAVGVLLPNGPSVVAALFAVLASDAAYVPLNPRLTDNELRDIIATIEPAAVVTDAPGRVPDAPAHAVPDGSGGWRITGTIDPHGRRLGGDVALVQFTSGTTGPPKPVPLKGSTVQHLMDGVVAKLRGSSGRSGHRDREPDREPGRTGAEPTRPPMPNLIPLSLSLWAGIYNVLFAFAVGAPAVLMERFDTREFARLVSTFEIRSVVLPPAAMTMLADDDSISDLRPLRLVRSVSAPLSPLQARRFHDRFGATVLNGYGQTELGGEVIGWSAADAREHGDDKLGSIGRPHEGIEVRVVGDDGQPLPAEEVGELWIRTPASSGEPDDALADRVDAEGYVRTGDFAWVDADGFVWIEGRASDMINRGGLKVFPAEVVEVLLLRPEVRDAAVVGVPDDRVGEVPWAFVVTEQGHVDPRAVRDHCRAELAPYKVPVEIVAVTELPRNEAGKVVPRELVDQATRRQRGATA